LKSAYLWPGKKEGSIANQAKYLNGRKIHRIGPLRLVIFSRTRNRGKKAKYALPAEGGI